MIIFKIVGNDLYLLVPREGIAISGEIDINRSALLIDEINKILKGYGVGTALEFEQGEPIQIRSLGLNDCVWYFPIIICALWVIEGGNADKFTWTSLGDLLTEVGDSPDALNTTVAGTVACEAALFGLSIPLDHLD
ncbi:MAG: hypothetical protein WCX69_04390 [Candidatus Paceibacterota bacterium]